MISRLALLCVGVTLAFSGCSKPQEGSDPPPLASPSPSPSPSISKSAVPLDAKTAIPYLARAYLEERNRAIRTGDTKRLRALATSDCECQAFADRIDADWRRGRVESPNFYRIERLGTVVLDSATQGSVTVFYRATGYRVVDRAGKVLVDTPADAKTESTVIFFRHTDAGWKAFRVANVVD